MQYKVETSFSNAEQLIAAVPPIEIDDIIAMCYVKKNYFKKFDYNLQMHFMQGVNDFGWGHPVVYITLNTNNIATPSTCKYCGLRYVMRNQESH